MENAAVNSALLVTEQAGRATAKVLIDTGSVISILQEDFWTQGHAAQLCDIIPTDLPMVAANGAELDLLGQTTVILELG